MLLSIKHQFSSVAKSCLTLCDPMDCSMPAYPVHHNSQSLLKLMSINSIDISYDNKKYPLKSFKDHTHIGRQIFKHWVSQKVHLGFSITSFRKTTMNFLANPILHSVGTLHSRQFLLWTPSLPSQVSSLLRLLLLQNHCLTGPCLQLPPPRYTSLSKISDYMQCLKWIIFCSIQIHVYLTDIHSIDT